MINASPAQFREIGEKGRQYSESVYSRDAFLKPFDEAFAAVGLGVA
jgi:hypothetical protein